MNTIEKEAYFRYTAWLLSLSIEDYIDAAKLNEEEFIKSSLYSDFARNIKGKETKEGV